MVIPIIVLPNAERSCILSQLGNAIMLGELLPLTVVPVPMIWLSDLECGPSWLVLP